MNVKINSFVQKILIVCAITLFAFTSISPLLQLSQTLAQDNQIAEDKILTSQEVLLDLAKTRDFLEQSNISPVIIQRLDSFRADYQLNKIAATKKQTSAIAKNIRPFKVSGEGEIIKKKASELKGSPLNSAPSAISNLKLEKNDSLTEILSPTNSEQALQQIIIQAESIPPEYSAEGEEIEFSQSIKDLADSLGKDPLQILNYVKNNIDYIPYYGVKKGSDSTLIERAGNDSDQAALLIALLRYSGYPTKYKQGQIKLSLNQVMNLLGVDDPLVAAQLLSKTHIPYVLYVDQNDEPLFFVIEHTWVEAYITYDYTRGIQQDENEANKMWVPMEPSLKTVYFSQIVDIIEEMNFGAGSFYEDYLNGNYGQQKPIEAYQQEIETYLAANHPELSYEDILTKSYKHTENLEFIPNTLPYEIIQNIGEYSQIPANLKHKLAFTITDKDTAIELLNCALTVHEIADKQLVLTYVAASSTDQDVINLYDSIYDIVPLSLVHMKPIIKVQGKIKCGGDSGAPEITLGKSQDLVMRFLLPKKENEQITEYEEDIIEKDLIVGNTEGIAINTDRIVLPELRPSQDTQTTEFLSAQKLYRTALNYLDRLQQSHNELAKTLGGEFTNGATRAIVFNGIEVIYQGNEPYSFSWKGLRIDSSAKVNYFSHFGQDIQRNQIRFLYLFGLEGSLDESSIFEEDYDIEAMSTVKGLRLINQGQIPGTSAVRIDSSNKSAIDTLNISEELKTEFRASVDAGSIIYTPTQQYTYQNWTGLVYIDLDPATGDAGYIIGEGLNGGYTVEEWNWWWKLLWKTGVLTNVTANFIAPTEGQEFMRGEKIGCIIEYSGVVNSQSNTWIEMGTVDSYYLPAGDTFLRAAYETNTTVSVRIKGRSLGTTYNSFDHIIIKKGEQYGIPPDLLKSLIHQEAFKKYDEQLGQYLFEAHSYRYEAHKDYDWYSRQSPSIPSVVGWRGLANHPEHHFTIGGHVVTGESILQGNQVPNGYCNWSYTTAAGKLKFPNNKCEGVTTTDLVALNPRQNWSNRSNWNFTAQLVLAASYGLGQTMYETAVNRGFDTRTDNGQPARPVEHLFDPEISIDLTAKHLKKMYGIHGDWWNALKYYNGGYVDPDNEEFDSEDYADAILKTWNNSNGIYKEINY